ncbi:hypothetical protein [Metabacillus kandeliae]|nr:hypothetical protein [Metabacillus kandeliae]
MTKRNHKTKSGLQTAKSLTSMEMSNEPSAAEKKTEKTRPRNQ